MYTFKSLGLYRQMYYEWCNVHCTSYTCGNCISMCHFVLNLPTVYMFACVCVRMYLFSFFCCSLVLLVSFFSTFVCAYLYFFSNTQLNGRWNCFNWSQPQMLWKKIACKFLNVHLENFPLFRRHLPVSCVCNIIINLSKKKKVFQKRTEKEQ